MPTYSYKRPIKAIDGTDEKYKADHLKHFFQNDLYNNILALSQDEKEQFFQMQTDYEWLMINLFGENVVNMEGIVVFLPAAVRRNETGVLVNQYKEWLKTK